MVCNSVNCLVICTWGEKATSFLLFGVWLVLILDSDYIFAILSSFSDCSMNVHHKCQTKVANLCGINQKLLAEALTQVSIVYINVCTSPCYEALNLKITALKY